MNHRSIFLAIAAAGFTAISTCAQNSDASLGIFSGQNDIGDTALIGSGKFDAAKGTYQVTGGGGNMWFTNDAFHFVWKKVSGDASLAADISFVGTEGNPHRKACLLIRQNLNTDSPYADAAVHGSGLTSLQCRETGNATTREIQANIIGPTRLRIEKHGNYATISVAEKNGQLHPAGGAFELHLDGPYYIGLGVCAHDNATNCQAIFSNVQFAEEKPPVASTKLTTYSTLETVAIPSFDRRAIYFTTNHIEAPNWSRDGSYFLFNGGGHIYRLPVEGGEPIKLDTGFAIHCNNDHGISPDGKFLAISDGTKEKKSLVYIVPIDGGTPRQITKLGPSYWHGWSTDGDTLVFCGQRNDEFDVYSIPAAGGEEKRLTTAPGLDDGPEFSPDTQYVYFNSERTGQMQIWRMAPDGSHPEQITSDEYNNWFPHLSPNGKWLAFLSYDKTVTGHPENKTVLLRLMPAEGGKIQVIAKLFGGQGTINVPSWSPDSTKLAFMSYQIAP
ncbi:MAG TPA: hypothetical protein VH413_20475 [Verrucomicrobiae bacterium]|jgi:hypothetical protein|nr:hypothetical protein [Verrucomicrobiae bacterium]